MGVVSPLSLFQKALISLGKVTLEWYLLDSQGTQ